jgi:homoserine kinase
MTNTPMPSPPEEARASAPASIGNVGVGYDVLGLAFDAARDQVHAVKNGEPGVRLGAVSGLAASLPDATGENCALAAASAVLRAANATFGVTLDIRKGIPMSAGMGGSAASAVAAAGAVNSLLNDPFTVAELLPFALEGEAVSANPPPWDNVMASLFGGLVIAARLEPPLVKRLPAPQGLTCVLFHPDRKTETQSARDLLAATVAQRIAVEHARNIAGFVAGCTTDDHDLIRAGLRDIFIEPQRLPLLPELAEVQRVALQAGALGCSFSGSGPSVFAWAAKADTDRVIAAMQAAFDDQSCAARLYQAPLECDGLRVETGS